MSKNTGSNVTHLNFGYRRKISMAYTLNNYQPVRCTIIGDQPLFFMDYEGAFEADSFAAGIEGHLDESFLSHALDHGFDPLDAVETIENGVAQLQARVMNALDHGALEALMEEDRASSALALFQQDSDFVCTAGAADVVMHEDAAYILSLIGKSHFGAALIENARKYETAFIMGGAVSSAQYDRRQNSIFINPHLNEYDQILLVTRELRRVWQHRHGALVHPLTFHPDQAVLVHRAQVADLCVAMVRTAWEMQLSNHTDAWERLEESSMADLARAFAREAYMDFRAVNNGEAAAAVFEAWFLSERCRQEDRRLIQQMLADYQGYVFENINPSTAVTAELILALGSQPGEQSTDKTASSALSIAGTKAAGKNYLAPYVQSIMNDALFTEIRDRSNANFLWFIKFERSFRETEQELQTLDTSSVSGAHQKNPPNAQENNQRFGDHHEQKADIVSLPRGKAHSGIFQGAGFGHAPAGGATVIEFHKQPQKQPGKA
ncbi:MAG TPA: DUF6782 family putative metallopeptidase [Micavibrio sp.]